MIAGLAGRVWDDESVVTMGLGCLKNAQSRCSRSIRALGRHPDWLAVIGWTGETARLESCQFATSNMLFASRCRCDRPLSA